MLTSKCASRHNGVRFFDISISKSGQNYSTSSDPHHDISWWGSHRYQQRNTNDVPSSDPLKFYSTWSCTYLEYLLAFCVAIFWSFIWQIFFLAFDPAYLLTHFLPFYLAYLPAFYLVYILAFYLAYILAFYVAFYVAYILAVYVAYILAVYLAYILAVFLAYILAFHLAAEVQRCPLSSEGPRLRSSGAHWARKVPGWGPAVPTAVKTRAHSDRKPAVEVQQCPLRGSWRRAKSWQGGSGRGSGGRGGGGEGGGRGGGGGEGGGAGTAVIKSNNPHLAGGEKVCFVMSTPD